MARFTLVGVDGNAFAVMAYTRKVMKQAGLEKDIPQMLNDAQSSDYNHLLCVCDDYIDKCNEALGL